MLMNKIEIKINATLENEAVVRNTMGLFAATINCTIEFLRKNHIIKKEQPV